MQPATIAKAFEVDPREDKLPRWAQEKMATLRRATLDAVSAYDELREGTRRSSFYIWDHDDQKRFYLPDRASLVFGDGDRSHNLGLYDGGYNGDPGWLRVSGDGEIMVKPQAANVVLIKVCR
jgi:hypothetical protein